MIAKYIKYTAYLLLLFYNSNVFAGSCNGHAYDLCWQNRCDEYITVDLESNSSYPYDSYYDRNTQKYVCPDGGCKLCGIDSAGNKSDDCFSPFPILNQIKNGRFTLNTTTTLLYSTPGFIKSCGSKNYKELPYVSDILGGLINKEDGFTEKTNSSFSFDKSYNPSGYGSNYIYAPAKKVGPGDYYLLQPRIVTHGDYDVLEFYLSQWGWHISDFVSIDGTPTANYFDLQSTNFSASNILYPDKFNWDMWRKLIICDDYNDRDNNDGSPSMGTSYSTSDDRYCYIKINLWNRLHAVVQSTQNPSTSIADCDPNDVSGLGITMYDDNTQSDSIHRLSGVCKVNVDRNNARSILNSGIVIAPKPGQYNFLNSIQRFRRGQYSMVTEPTLSITESANSTYLSPKVTLTATGGNPNSDNNTETIDLELGPQNFEYQDGLWKYRLLLNIENNNYLGSQPELCLYGCRLDSYDECMQTGKTLDDLIINELDKDVIEDNKDIYSIDECIPHKTIAEIDSVQDYSLEITGLGIDSDFINPRVKVTITNRLDTSETVEQIFYLRSYEDINGNQEIPYSNIEQYTDLSDIPDYQLASGDTHDYLSFDFANIAYVIMEMTERSVYSYLKNAQGYELTMPFLFNTRILYDDTKVLTESSSNTILAKPCTEFLRTNSGCYFENAIMGVNCDSNPDSNMCNEEERYRSFLCLNNLNNEFYRFYSSDGTRYSESLKDTMYTVNNHLITNDYVNYVNSSEYNNLDPQFPSAGHNLCIPNYLYLNTSQDDFHYELSTTGLNTATINLKMTRSDNSQRVFNDLDVPDSDNSIPFDYTNFIISNMSVAEKNTYCEASTNANFYDIRYDYYHKFLFKIYNRSGFIYVCYKKYDSPSSSELANDWEILPAFTMDYYTGTQIFSDFINLNICPAYSGTQISDFLSCPDQLVAHYNPNGNEVWCSCSASADWNSFTTAEQNASWSNLNSGTIEVKAKCMMDGSWQMVDSSGYCPVYCEANESGLNGVLFPKTLAVEDIKSSNITAACLPGLSLEGGAITGKCSGIDLEEGTWTDINAGGTCVASCPTTHFNTSNNSVANTAASKAFTLPAQQDITTNTSVTVDCLTGYQGTASATCDYTTSQWVNVTNTCNPIKCPAGWQTSANTLAYSYLYAMSVDSGTKNCANGDGHEDAFYYNYNHSVQVNLPETNYGDSVSRSCSASGNVKINGSTSNSIISGSNNITSTCMVSGSGDSATAYWNIDISACKAMCNRVRDNTMITPGTYDGNIKKDTSGCGSGKHRNRYCRGTCSNSTSNRGVWEGVYQHNGSCN